MRRCAVRLRAASHAAALSLSGRGADATRTAGGDPFTPLAAGLVLAQVVPWPVLVTQEWLAIVGWVKVGAWAIVVGGIIVIVVGAFVAWRKGEG